MRESLQNSRLESESRARTWDWQRKGKSFSVLFIIIY